MNGGVILCYGDSNTWGADPKDLTRFPRNVRWPGHLGKLLGAAWHLVEEGSPNRTSAFEDPIIPLRNGAQIFPLFLESHSPLDLVIVMLGSNDPKDRIRGRLVDAVSGLASIGDAVVASGARALFVAPPPMRAPIKFEEFKDEIAIPYLDELSRETSSMCEKKEFGFIDAGKIVSASTLDGVHLDQRSHTLLATDIAEWVHEN